VYFSDLNCEFLSLDNETAAFHTGLANVVNAICVQEGNLTCDVVDATSFCGSVLSSLTVDVTFPLTPMVLSQMLNDAINNGDFQTLLAFEGWSDVGGIELFPLNMSLIIDLRGPLVHNASFTRLEETLIEFVRSNLSAYDAISTSALLIEKTFTDDVAGDVIGMEFVIYVDVVSVFDYELVRRFDVRLGEELESMYKLLDAENLWRVPTSPNSTLTTEPSVTGQTTVSRTTVSVDVNGTTNASETSSASDSTSSNINAITTETTTTTLFVNLVTSSDTSSDSTSAIEIVVSVLAVIVLMLIVLLTIALVLRRRHAEDKKIGVLRRNSKRSSKDSLSNDKHTASFHHNRTFQAELMSESSLTDFWEQRNSSVSSVVPEVVYDDDVKLNGEVEALSHNDSSSSLQSKNNISSMRGIVNAHYYPKQTTPNGQPEFWASPKNSPSTTPSPSPKRTRQSSSSSDLMAVPELGGIDDRSLSPLRDSNSPHSPSPDLTQDWVVWGNKTNLNRRSLSEFSDLNSDSENESSPPNQDSNTPNQDSSTFSPVPVIQSPQPELSGAKGFMPSFRRWRKSVFNPREAAMDRRASYMSVDISQEDLDDDRFELKHSPSRPSRSNIVSLSPRSPESFRMQDMSTPKSKQEHDDDGWLTLNKRSLLDSMSTPNPKQEHNDDTTDADGLPRSSFNRSASNSSGPGGYFQDWLEKEDVKSRQKSGFADTLLDEYVTLNGESQNMSSSGGLHVPSGTSPIPPSSTQNVRSSFDMNLSVDEAIAEADEEADEDGYGKGFSGFGGLGSSRKKKEKVVTLIDYSDYDNVDVFDSLDNTGFDAALSALSHSPREDKIPPVRKPSEEGILANFTRHTMF